MVDKSSKSNENRCTHCAIRLVLIGKDAHRKGNIRYVRNWSQAIESNFSCFFSSKIVKITKDKCFHCAMALNYHGLPKNNGKPRLFGHFIAINDHKVH